jgi:hypothetical protein
MAYPFRPLKERQLRKLNREREDSDFDDSDSNRSIEFESPVADPRRKTRALPALSTNTSTENIISQPWPHLSRRPVMIKL